ncbi:PP2C family protein-serine/threonine phosphatase [Paenibacillus sp. MBLB4367]|uniref:PP2C family protein-serine/threonine phosphatase n=1 Tax=Paenibacillus sp. MBLB4367 TaxID=3384767 RepID=UPI0039081B19
MLAAVWLLGCAVAASAWLWAAERKKRRTAEHDLERTRMLFEVSLEINSTIHKQDLLQTIMKATADVVNAEASSIILVDMHTGELYFELALGSKGEEVREIRLAMGEGIAGWVAQTGESVRIDDAARDPRWSSKVAKKVEYETRNMLCVPVMNRGEVVGVIQVLNKRGKKPFDDRDEQLLKSIAAPTAIALENAALYEALEKSLQALRDTTTVKEKMESELRIARDIQMSFLPKAATETFSAIPYELYHGAAEEVAAAAEGDTARPAMHKAEVGALLRPAREVGGDFYNYYPIDGRHLFIILGDVSDKGIPAALFMAVTLTLLKARMMPGRFPGEVLSEVNEELCRDESAMFATIWCGLLDMETGDLTYSDGGHCTAYVVSENGAVAPLKSRKGLPLGAMEEAPYYDQRVTLTPGDSVVLYTDGITEAEDAERRQFGTARLSELLPSVALLSAEEGAHELLASVDRFADGAPQSDDIAVLVVNWGRENSAA